jgi:hypothetical protein
MAGSDGSVKLVDGAVYFGPQARSALGVSLAATSALLDRCGIDLCLMSHVRTLGQSLAGGVQS